MLKLKLITIQIFLFFLIIIIFFNLFGFKLTSEYLLGELMFILLASFTYHYYQSLRKLEKNNTKQ